MIDNRSQVRLGTTATHLRFLGGLVPGEDGSLPRDAEGKTVVQAGLERLADLSPARLEVAQVSIFSGSRGIPTGELAEVFSAVRALGMTPEMILMIGGVNAMEAADEDAFVDQGFQFLQAAKDLGVETVISTSFEDWMNAIPRKEGSEFEAAVEQVIKAHLRLYREGDLAHSGITSWHLEFLRPVEFNTFTDLGRAWQVVKGLNEELGEIRFRSLVDASHCGDSGLSLAENREIIQEIGAAGALGGFHASAKTTRGCLTSDDGWIANLLTACAQTGGLETVAVEAFDHEDPALEPLRAAVPGHGVDTRDGRTLDQMMADGIADVAHRLNNLVARGML